MTKYIIRRILISIPTLFIITVLAFIISVNAPGDPVERLTSTSQNGEQNSGSVNRDEQQIYWRKKLGLDLPLFYFSMHSISVPDTIYKIYDPIKRETLLRLISNYGNWNFINNYYQKCYSLKESLNSVISSGANTFTNEQVDKLTVARNEINLLSSLSDEKNIFRSIQHIKTNLQSFDNFAHKAKELENTFILVTQNKTSWKNFFPVFSFYKNNQYHRWLFGDSVGNSKGILRGDLGISYVTKQPISQVIGEKLGWSLFFSLFSILFAYLISIPIGIKAAVNKNSFFDKSSSLVLFFLFSLPSFWVATLLLMVFANPESLQLFPASGIKPATGYPETATLFEKIKISLPYLILPAICYTYSSYAFLSRAVRISMIEEINKDYIRTARAKGLTETKVIYKHAFRNALFPIITLFANVFPLVIGGSVILETIFSIPGMGLETYTAIQNQNYPMIIAIFTITGMLTIVGYLVSDLLYAIADPRISFSSPTDER